MSFFPKNSSDFLLKPSYMMHTVPHSQEENVERIAISFNLQHAEDESYHHG